MAPASAALGAPLQQYPNPLLLDESQADAAARLAGDLAPCVLLRLQPVGQILLHPFFSPLLHVSCIPSGRGDLPSLP